MSCFKTAGRTICNLPARRPAIARAVPRRGIESQPGYDGKGVPVPRIDGYPFATAAFSETAELRRTYRRADQTRCTEHVRDCTGTIVTGVIKRFVTPTVAVWLRAKSVRSPNRLLYFWRRFLGRSRLAGRVNARLLASDDWPRHRKNIGM